MNKTSKNWHPFYIGHQQDDIRVFAWLCKNNVWRWEKQCYTDTDKFKVHAKSGDVDLIHQTMKLKDLCH